MPIDRDDPFPGDLLIDQSHYVDTAAKPVMVVAVVKLPIEVVGEHAERIRVPVAASEIGGKSVAELQAILETGQRRNTSIG